jgi:hypothetical protein
VGTQGSPTRRSTLVAHNGPSVSMKGGSKTKMRNKFAGTCYRCGLPVAPREGHFERARGKGDWQSQKYGWRLQHAECAIKYRGMKFEYGKVVGD